MINNYKLFIDEECEYDGIYGFSIVSTPAIESNFIALSKEEEIIKEVKLAEISKERRILMGPALIPNKKILRGNKNHQYTIEFDEETILKASQLFHKQSNQSNSTLEHSSVIEGLTIVESWIIEDPAMDKSNLYNMDVPKGTWMISVKVDNDEVWDNYIKDGKVKGFSIEGIFSNRQLLSKMKFNEEEILLEQIKNIIIEDGK